MKRSSKALTAFFLAMSATIAGGEEAAPDIKTTALVGVTVIDGRGNPPLENQTLIIEGERIKELFTTGKGKVPGHATQVSLEGKYLLPGLIDSHVHLATDPERGEDVEDVTPKLGRYLRGGVTAVRDMGGDTRVLAYLARQALIDKIDSPDIFYSTIIGGPEFFEDPRTVSSAKGFEAGTTAWMRAVTIESDLATILSQARGNGATGIKIYRNVPSDLMAPLAKEAARQGLKSWSHLDVDPAPPQAVADAGVTAVSHAAYFLGRARGEQQRWKEEVIYSSKSITTAETRQLIDTLADNNVILDATLVIFDRGARNTGKPHYINTQRAGVDFTRAAYAAGVRIAAGTDQGINMLYPTPSIHDELELLVEQAGLTPLDAVAAATSHGAILLGKENEFGAIEAGLKANLLVLNSNPLEDIGNSRDIAHVVKNGRFIYRGFEGMGLPFSDARVLGNQLLMSGQIGNIPGTFTLVKGGIAAETEQVLRNIESVLRNYGLNRKDVRKCTVMLADIDEWGEANTVYADYFWEEPRPSRSAFAGSGLALDARIEMECIAELR